MKKQTLLLFFLLCCNFTNLFATTCSENITLTSQAEVDAFPTDYGCTVIDGNLTIIGDDISDLTPLNNLTSIGGFLEIAHNDDLTNLAIFNNLEYVERLKISNNASLTHIDELASTNTVVEFWIIIQNNENLLNVDGLTGVEAEFAEIINNDALENVDGLTGHFYNLEIEDNDNLSYIDGSNITMAKQDWGLFIRDNANLLTLTNFEYVGSEYVYISNNASLTSIDNWFFDSFGGSEITIINNPKLEVIQAKADLDVTDLIIENNSNLTDVNIQINHLSGSGLIIENNDLLTNLDGFTFPVIEDDYSFVHIQDNDLLVDIEKLSSLETINDLRITDNASLEDCCILEDLILDDMEVNISNNAEGCNSLNEIEESCDTDLPNDPDFEDFPWLYDVVDLDDCCNNTTVTQYSNGSYSYIWIESDDECGTEDATLYNQNGLMYCQNNSSLNCFDFYDLNEYEATILWTCEEEPTPPTPPTPEDPFEDFEWLNDIVDLEDCCNNTTVTLYDNGSYAYIWIESNDACGTIASTLYNEEGVKYCRNHSNLDCFEFYDLDEYEATVLWTCEEEPTPPTPPTPEDPFEDFEWLNDIVDLDDCCNNTTVTQYSNGSYSYIWIESNDACGTIASTLYNEEGVKYCRNNSSLDCFEFYDLDEYEATVLWTCEDEAGFKINNGTNATNSLDFRLYPNPAQDQINISFAQITNELIQLQITDYTGRVIKEMNINNSIQTSISLEDLASGTYILSVFDGTTITTQKFVKIY